MESVLAWHFLVSDCHTRREEGYPPPVLVEVGKTLFETRPLRMCKVGLHASIRPLDALHYAPGPIACRVKMSGAGVTHPEHPDKLCYSERTVIAMADASTVLHEFACWCAENALNRERSEGREPDPCSWAAIEAKRLWLRGEISIGELSAARGASWSAVESAARSAAWNVAESVAESAARSAAWSAAGIEARSAAESAVKDNQNAELEARLLSLLGR